MLCFGLIGYYAHLSFSDVVSIKVVSLQEVISLPLQVFHVASVAFYLQLNSFMLLDQGLHKITTKISCYNVDPPSLHFVYTSKDIKIRDSLGQPIKIVGVVLYIRGFIFVEVYGLCML